MSVWNGFPSSVWAAFYALRRPKNKRASIKSARRASRKLDAWVAGRWLTPDEQFIRDAFRAEMPDTVLSSYSAWANEGFGFEREKIVTNEAYPSYAEFAN